MAALLNGSKARGDGHARGNHPTVNARNPRVPKHDTKRLDGRTSSASTRWVGRCFARRRDGNPRRRLARCGRGRARTATPPPQCAVRIESTASRRPVASLSRRLKATRMRHESCDRIRVGGGQNGTSRKEPRFRIDSRLDLEKALRRPGSGSWCSRRTDRRAGRCTARCAREVIPLRPALVIGRPARRRIPRRGLYGFGSRSKRDLNRGRAATWCGGQPVRGPRDTLLMNTDAIRVRALERAPIELPLFKRYDTMQYWWSNGRLRPRCGGQGQQTSTADRATIASRP